MPNFMEQSSIVNENEVKKPEADQQRNENGFKISEAHQQSKEINTGKIPSATSDGSGHRLNLEEQRGNENQKESSDDKFNRSKKSVRWNEELVIESPRTPSLAFADRSNPDVTPNSPTSPSSPKSFNFKSTMGNVKDMLGRWRKKVGEASRKAEDLAGNTWQHLKTGPSFADAALGRIAQGTKVLAEGGYEKIFQHTFETAPEEQLQETYSCYLSTSAGPVMGVLYVSSAKLAFCSDNPLSYKAGDKTEWSYYKVIIPLHQLKEINPSSSRANPAEKYIQVISVDKHEFWFMGFLNYNDAVKCLQEILQTCNLESV